MQGALWRRLRTRRSENRCRAFLDISPLTKASAEHGPLFRQALEELRAAQSRGALKGDNLAPSYLARAAGDFARFIDPQAIIEAEWMLVERTAGELRESCPKLYTILVARTSSGRRPSLLAVAVRYYFRREVESDPELFRGLAFAKLGDIKESQDKGFAALTDALSRQGQRLEGMLRGMKETGEDTNARVLRLEQQIQRLLEQFQLQGRELRPGDSMSMRSDGEQQRVRQLVKEYRDLPDDQRRQRPELLTKVGVLEAAAGEMEDAQKDFQEAARTHLDPKASAEAHHNAYRAALERQQWAEALAALRQAVTLDSARFAPFPFERYEPQRILGAGGLGVVFLCRDRLLDRPVVVKALLPSELDRSIAGVFAEARALVDLQHPAIIRLWHCDYADAARTRPYLVMDYFEGTNLADHVATHGKLSPGDLMAIARPVAEALQAAHAKGILHRDIKPGNLLVRREGTGWKVKLIDFGLALRPEALQGKVSTQGPQAHTTTGRSIAGTLHYAAPEQMGQASGVPVGAYSDVYGFGKTCYYALLKVPDPDDEEKEDLPDDWRRLLSKCTRRAVANRLPDFAAVLADLAAGGKPPPDFEQDMNDALEEMRTRGDNRAYFGRQGPTRIAAWRAAAEKGVAAAQWLLACCLYEGKGVQKDIPAAVALLRLAADTGLAVAQTDLGDCYYSGEGVKADANEAFRLYTAAADKGFAEAVADLGDCYYEGKGVPKDLAEAARGTIARRRRRVGRGGKTTSRIAGGTGPGSSRTTPRLSAGTARPPSRGWRARRATWGGVTKTGKA